MTIHKAYQILLLQLYEVYHNREAANIANMVIEHVTGQRMIDRIMYKDLPVNEQQQRLLEQYAQELLQHKPIQYVLGEAWFYNLKLFVNEHVLIPRPETEELVEWIVEENEKCKMKNEKLSILEVGTGSGCIPIALKVALPEASVTAVDVSADALIVANKNALIHNAEVTFKTVDFLNEGSWSDLEECDIIVSNPPYIKASEENEIRENVLKHEPHLALFVPDNNALVFYEAIAKFGRTHLKAGGAIYVEINEALGEATKQVFIEQGYGKVELKKDMQQKDRMIKASIGK
ncbi:MAG: prmC [Segetibacter sp.]|nr:prmC [Segetibacter sp.]